LPQLLWKQAEAAAAKDNAMVPAGIFIQSLNVMSDNREKRVSAIADRVPNIILMALYGIAIFAGAARNRWVW
jgi:hypothetical protein